MLDVYFSSLGHRCPGEEPFDGTHAVLCSVAHLVYQLQLRRDRNYSDGFLPQHERGEKNDKALSESSLHSPPADFNDAAESLISLRNFVGDSFCLEREMVSVSVVGTLITYRILDFDLGRGLVFAFMSAF